MSARRTRPGLAGAVPLAVLLLALLALAACQPPRTLTDIAYGPREAHRLDLYLPGGEGPHPLVIYIHGGGWWSGSKSNTPREYVDHFLDRGVAFAAIDYSKLEAAAADGLFPPVLGPLGDCRRALQFLRMRASEYRLDPARIGAFGSSAGGFNALWLALKPDQALPDATDPVERVSTRLTVGAGVNPQTTIDPNQMRQWAGPDLRYGGHAFGLMEKDFEGFLARRDEFAPLFEGLSPVTMIGPDRPPIHLLYDTSKPVELHEHIDLVHSSGFGLGFMRIAQRKGQPASMSVTGLRPREVRAEFLDRIADALLRPAPAPTQEGEVAVPPSAQASG